MDRTMGHRVSQMERMLGASSLAKLTDAELDAAITDTTQQLIDSYASSLDCCRPPVRADRAEAELQKWVAWGEQAARAIAGRTAPKQEEAGR